MNWHTHAMTLVLVALLTACQGPGDPFVQVDRREAYFANGIALESPALTAELKTHLQALRTLDPGGDTADFAPLKPLVASARVVALGEATHGSHETFLLKRRLVEWLVNEQGFSVVVFEANWPETLPLAAYIERGQGTAEQAISQLGYPIWKTEEIKDLLSWMADFNRKQLRSPPLAVSGMDLQNPRRAIEQLTKYLDTTDPALATRAREAVACFPWEGIASYASRPQAERETCASGLGALYHTLEDDSERLIAASSPEAYRVALRHAWLVRQAERLWNTRDEFLFNSQRDQAMADQVRWLADEVYPGRKLILWAHNLHVSRESASHNTTPMGFYLRQIYADAYVGLASTFNKGVVQAAPTLERLGDTVSLVPTAIAEAERGSIEAALATATTTPGYLNLKTLTPGSPVDTWGQAVLPMHAIGVGAGRSRRDHFSPVSLKSAFDALFYLPETTPSRTL